MLLPFHPTFVAKRLNVFEFFINPAYANGHHYLYVAFRKDDDQPTPVVTMVIPCEYYSVLKDSPVDWLEESSEHRRKRYGDELATAFQDRVFGEPFLPTLITERLRVFEFCIKPARLNGPRYLYVAFRKDDNPPTPVATAVIPYTHYLVMNGRHVDWLEVPSEHRRRNYGRELLTALQSRFLGDLLYSGATDAGEAFLDAVFPAEPEAE